MSWAFGAGVAARNAWYDRKPPAEPPLPTVSVGNLTVGGTGKTPLLRALATWFEGRGHSCALVTRGYGADELSLYRGWLGSDRVIVAPERQEGLLRAAEMGLAVALIDDGFQHRRAPRSLDLLLVSADAPYPVRLLPWGPYREPLRSAGRSDLVVVTTRAGGEDPGTWLARMEQAAPGVPVLSVALGALGWQPLAEDDGSDGPPAAPEGTSAGYETERPIPSSDSVVAVASTADPSGFARLLRATWPDLEVELASYPDHFEYDDSEARDLVGRAGDRSIVTTEKDAVKLASFPCLLGRTWVVGFGVVEPLPAKLTSALSRILEGAPR